MAAAVIDARILPNGSLSLIAGPAGDLLDHVRPGDAIAFTGSADTAEKLRAHPRIRAGGIRFNVEADSLNAAILGPDTPPGSATFDAFVREVAREMTTKAGQKCTAIRRVIVPEELGDAVSAAIAAVLATTIVGDPSDDTVTMGPIVSQSQRDAVDAGLARLSPYTTIEYRMPDEPAGRFVSPTLLRARDNAASLIHELEIFGPVATIITYREPAEAFALARRGGGSLAISIFSEDAAFLVDAARAVAPSHGRVMLVDESVATTHTGHGIVLPSLIHGGPGRAGGGEELGGLRGLSFYSQWSAVQGSSAVLASIGEGAASVRA
jgi:3,4-dehydroadipyl-CoA semialdehyde dehydrogenase